MTEQELARLIAEGEGLYLEFKAPRTKPAALARTLVALANTGGGRIIIGIDDICSRFEGSVRTWAH
jgi:predicted HTH transcriptional regulator